MEFIALLVGSEGEKYFVFLFERLGGVESGSYRYMQIVEVSGVAEGMKCSVYNFRWKKGRETRHNNSLDIAA